MFRVSKLYLKSLTLTIKRTFYEAHRAGHPPVYNKPHERLSVLQIARKVCHEFKDECKLFFQEVKNGVTIYPHADIVGEEVDIVWKFDGTQKSLDKWVVNADKDYGYGHSFANLDFSSYGTGIFHGVLDTRVPKDGRTTDTGYCNITTMPRYISFQRKAFYDWTDYNELVLRVRGDGRAYMLNVLQKGQFLDLARYNTFHYVMYTRGGPYWQTVRIPFAKFLFGTKGEINENQYSMPRCVVSNFGITIADKKPGPFRLEIDYIGVAYNCRDNEEFAYELYDVPRIKAQKERINKFIPMKE